MPVETLGLEFFANYDCIDRINVAVNLLPMISRISTLRDAVGNESVASCGEVAMHCNKGGVAESAVRLFCAATCKCDDPASSLALPFGADGCPLRWCRTASRYTSVQAARQC